MATAKTIPKNPLKVLVVFGTRPEAIKMAPVVRSLRKRPNDFKTVVVLTAQHRQMLDQVMNLFKITSDYDLNIMHQNQTLEYVVTEVINKVGPILEKEKPDLVLVHGDTVTTFAAALSAFYHKIPIGHVEAGLRSYDMANPFPEESNRVLADHLCTPVFCADASGEDEPVKRKYQQRTHLCHRQHRDRCSFYRDQRTASVDRSHPEKSF